MPPWLESPNFRSQYRGSRNSSLCRRNVGLPSLKSLSKKKREKKKRASSRKGVKVRSGPADSTLKCPRSCAAREAADDGAGTKLQFDKKLHPGFRESPQGRSLYGIGSTLASCDRVQPLSDARIGRRLPGALVPSQVACVWASRGGVSSTTDVSPALPVSLLSDSVLSLGGLCGPRQMPNWKLSRRNGSLCQGAILNHPVARMDDAPAWRESARSDRWLRCRAMGQEMSCRDGSSQAVDLVLVL
jgi:hypothetical protein